MKPAINPSEKKVYEKIIEDATIDCYDEHEQISGWVCLLDEIIKTPYKCVIGKERAILEKIDSNDNSNVVIGIINLNKTRIRVLIQDVVLENSEAMKYVNAYKYWCKNG